MLNAVGEGVARKGGHGDPTERERLADVTKCQRVIKHQQDIAHGHQSKCSDDPLPTERVEGLANILRIVAGDLTMEGDKRRHRIKRVPGQFPNRARSDARGSAGSMMTAA